MSTKSVYADNRACCEINMTGSQVPAQRTGMQANYNVPSTVRHLSEPIAPMLLEGLEPSCVPDLEQPVIS